MIAGRPGSAHCLRYDDNWWYRGYAIGNYRLDFEIQVHVTRSRPNQTSGETTRIESPWETETISLSPSRMSATSSDNSIYVELLGDLASYAELESFKDYWLMIPVQPGVSPNEIFSMNLDMWTIFPPSKVSTTGDCDKIGVDYAHFRHQVSKCDAELGSCLQNQIYDFELEDERRIKQGLEPLFNIRKYGGGYENKNQIQNSGPGLSLKLPVKQIRSSIVVLTLKADDVHFITNIGQGAIEEIKLCHNSSGICDTFEAITGVGFLEVTLRNNGTIDAAFLISIINCTSGILPVLEQRASLKAGESSSLVFELQAEFDVAFNASCLIQIRNALGIATDQRRVSFSIGQTKYNPIPDQSDLGNKV